MTSVSDSTRLRIGYPFGLDYSPSKNLALLDQVAIELLGILFVLRVKRIGDGFSVDVSDFK